MVTLAYYRLLRNNVFISSKCDSFDEFARTQNLTFSDYQQIDIIRPKTIGPFKVNQLIIVELITGFMISMITMSVFPGLVAQVRSTSDNSTWAEYFPAIVTFLLFNIFDYIGRSLTNFVTLWVS